MDNSTIDLHGSLIEPAFLNILKEYLVFEDLPAKCLPSPSTSLHPTDLKIEDDGKQILKQMFDNCPRLSRTRVEMYGLPEELAENLKIYRDFPSNHRVFGFPEKWPYNTTITKYKCQEKNKEFIYKQDLFTYIHHLGLKYFGSHNHVLVFQTLFLRKFEAYYDDRCEFIEYDQKWMDDLEKKFKKLWKKAEEAVSDPSFIHANIYSVLTPLFLRMTPNWMTKKEEMHLLPTVVVIRVFNNGFIFEKELNDAMKLTQNMIAPVSSKPLYPFIVPLAFYSKCDGFAQRFKNVTFVNVEIKRAKHAAVPILSPFGGHCISSVDAFFEIFRVLVFRHRIFQKFKKHQWLKVKTMLMKILGGSFDPHMTPFFISVNVVKDLKASLAKEMMRHKDLPFLEYRRVDHEGFTLDELKDELNHSKLDEFFPEIARYAAIVYEEVNAKKLKPVLRTCDFYDALERCQLVCFLEKMIDLKLFLHQQNGCPRVPQLRCDYCKSPVSATTKFQRYIKAPDYNIEEMTITFWKEKEDDLNYCSLVLNGSEMEFYSNLIFFTPSQIQRHGVRFFILDSNDVVKRDKKELLSLSHYVKIHPFKKLYLRAIPTNTFDESRRVFTEEVLEIVQVLLKLHAGDARLRHYRKKWPPSRNMTIDLTELGLVLEAFDVDKKRIRIIPDAFHERTVYHMLTEPEPLYFRVLSPYGNQMVMRPYQLIYFLFRRVVCSLNWTTSWNKGRCKIHKNCLEGFRKMVLGKMKEIAELDENAYIPTTLLDNILEGYEQLCPYLYKNPPTITPMYVLSQQKHDETIENGRFQDTARLFGLDESIKDHEEWNQENIRIDMARYRYLMALKDQFLKGDAEEIEAILENELWYCNSPRVEERKKPQGLDELKKPLNCGSEIQKNAQKSLDNKDFKKRTETKQSMETAKSLSTGSEQETGNSLKSDQESKNDASKVDKAEDMETYEITEKLAKISLQHSQIMESEFAETESDLGSMASESEVETAQDPEEGVGEDMGIDEPSDLKVKVKVETDVVNYESESVENADENSETAIPDKMTKKSGSEHQELAEVNSEINSKKNEPEVLERSSHLEPQGQNEASLDMEATDPEKAEKPEELKEENNLEIEINPVVSQSDDEVTQKSEGDSSIGKDVEADEHEDLKVKEETVDKIEEIVNDQTTEKSDPKHQEHAESDLETSSERDQDEDWETSTRLKLEVRVETPPDTEVTESEKEEEEAFEMEIKEDRTPTDVVCDSYELCDSKAKNEEEAWSVKYEENVASTNEKTKNSESEIVEAASVNTGVPNLELRLETNTETNFESDTKVGTPRCAIDVKSDMKMENHKELSHDDVGSDICEDSKATECAEANLEMKDKEIPRNKHMEADTLLENHVVEDRNSEDNSEDGTERDILSPPENEENVELEMKEEPELNNLSGDSCEDSEDSEATEDDEANPVEIPNNQHVEPKIELEHTLEGDEESENPVDNSEEVTEKEIISPLKNEEKVKLEIKRENESDTGNDRTEDPEATEDVEENPEMKDDGLPENQHMEHEVKLELSLEGNKGSQNPADNSEDVPKAEILMPLKTKEGVKIEVKEEQELSEMTSDSSEDSDVFEPVETKVMHPKEEIQVNQYVDPNSLEEDHVSETSETPEEQGQVEVENPVEDTGHLPKTETLPPLHVEIGNSRSIHFEMKDSGCSEASTLLELVTEESRKPIIWKNAETQTLTQKLPELRAKDKEIAGLKRANLQIAQQSKTQINQLQEKFEAKKSQLSQRITELEEELRMERDKVATPCHNNEVEELRKTIKVLQEINAAMAIRDEEKAKMIGMLMECLKGNPVTEKSRGEGVENQKAGSSVTVTTLSN